MVRRTDSMLRSGNCCSQLKRYTCARLSMKIASPVARTIAARMRARGNAMRIVLFILLSLFAPSLYAQTVYKCRDHKGQPLYQSFPCGGTQPAEKEWTGNYRQPTNTELWERYNRDQAWRARQQREQQRSYIMAPTRPSPAESARSASCRVSRSEYARVQADFKLNRKIDLLRRLEADIRRYCEVRP